MPNIEKEILKCKHPNSRKAIALSKKITRKSRNEKQKVGQYVKQNLVGEKIEWFKDNLDPDITVCTPEILEELIEKYLSRFDEELKQIKLKHSVGNRKNRQHASREDLINITKKNERNEFLTCGLEVPDFLNDKNFIYVKKWNGELRFLQNIKLKRYSKKQLQALAASNKNKKTETQSDKRVEKQESKSKKEENLSTKEEEAQEDESMDLD